MYPGPYNMLVLYQVYWRIIRFIGSTFAFVEVHIEINPYISRLSRGDDDKWAAKPYVFPLLPRKPTRIWNETRTPRGGTQQSFILGGFAPRSHPLPFYLLFLIGKVPVSYTFLGSILPAVNALFFLNVNKSPNQKSFSTFLQPWSPSLAL